MCLQNKGLATREPPLQFGEIVNSEMKVNQFGEIVKECWCEIPQKYQNVETDEFVVMPNHVHGIIIINDDTESTVGARSSRPDDKSISIWATQRRPYKITLGKIVAFFKYESTKRINGINNSIGSRIWQRNYFEHIIRNDDEMNHIREYIFNNPARWQQDEENWTQ